MKLQKNYKENIKKEIFAGETIKLSVTTDPENVKVDYKSSDETIATDPEELVGFLTEKGHPALSMEPMM